MSEIITREEEYPLWKIAMANVLERFEKEKYDSQFTHRELKDWMGIRIIEGVTTVEEVKKEQLDYMTGINKLSENLLDYYDVFLNNITGYGYQILHPSEQIRKGANKYLHKSQKAMSRFVRVLTNVDYQQLDTEDKRLQIEKINKAAFIKAAFRKRNLISYKQ